MLNTFAKTAETILVERKTFLQVWLAGAGTGYSKNRLVICLHLTSERAE
ncbi:MAG: hypothetical protein IKU46_02220 [Peptococcaceae bacterium]|nr:hypothetical protein [Peptococcaceae bacterium]